MAQDMGERIKSTIYRVPNAPRAPCNSLLASKAVEESTLPEEPSWWQAKKYHQDQGIEYLKRFYPYKIFPESAWSQIATYKEVVYPYVSSYCTLID